MPLLLNPYGNQYGLLNTQPNYIHNNYPNAFEPKQEGLLTAPTVAPPVVQQPWGIDPNNPYASPTNGNQAEGVDPGQGSLNMSDIGTGMQALGAVATIAGIPAVGMTLGTIGKGMSAAGGGANDAANANAAAEAAMSGGDVGIGGGLGIQGAGAIPPAANPSHSVGDNSHADLDAIGTEANGNTPGAKIICNELYRQGIMPRHIWEADERFGNTLDETTLQGYHAWAGPWVRVMKASPLATRLTWLVARPWAYHMAFKMKAVEEDNAIGRVMMKIGLPACKVVGKVNQTLRRLGKSFRHRRLWKAE